MEKQINTPKLRFPKFEGEWVEKQLEEISDNIMYGMNSAAIEFDGRNKYIRITDIDESSRKFILPEQTKIANFLSAIDDKINHCGKQIEKMEAWKKGLLQGMFV